MSKVPEEHIKTDVLILGGGLAGSFAAMKAFEHGCKVTVVEKNHIANSGANASGIDHFNYCYIPQIHGRMGLKVEDFVRAHTVVATNVIDQELCEMMWQDSYDRLLDLEKTGVKVKFDKIYPWNFGFKPGDYSDDPKYRLVPWEGFPVPAALNIEGQFIKTRLGEALRQLGVDVQNYHNTQDLLTRDGKVVGAIGFNIRTGGVFTVEAKAVVLATGALTRLFPSQVMFNRLVPPNQTAEGQTMAFRAGAELAVMEQYPWNGKRVLLGDQRLKNWMRSLPATPSGYPAGRIINAAGEEMPNIRRNFDQTCDEGVIQRQVEWVKRSIKEGKGIFYWDATMATEEERSYAEWSSLNEGGGIAFFLQLKNLNASLKTHQIELGSPVIVDVGKPRGFTLTSPSGLTINIKTETSVPGLYAAGELAYGQHFPSSPWAFATGARAGHHAAEYALKAPQPGVDQNQIDATTERLLKPLEMKDGATWQELNLAVGNIVTNYFRPPAETIKVGLQYVEDLKKEDVKARNAHELMRVMETMSLLSVSEIFMRAALFPINQNEWRIMRNADGVMRFSKKPIKFKYPIN
jgi:succinate dehydrogenase/fumarate reductase flavoprotein subunit